MLFGLRGEPRHFPAGSDSSELKRRCETPSFTFGLSQQYDLSPRLPRKSIRDIQGTVGRLLLYSWVQIYGHTCEQCSDSFILHPINHLNKEPTDACDPLMAAPGQRSLMDAAIPQHQGET